MCHVVLGFISTVAVSWFSNGGWEESISNHCALDKSGSMRFSMLSHWLQCNHSKCSCKLQTCMHQERNAIPLYVRSAAWAVWKALIAPVLMLLYRQVKWDTESNLSPFNLPTASRCLGGELFHRHRELKGLLCCFLSSLRAPKNRTSLTERCLQR